MKTRKTWREKLEKPQNPELIDTPKGRMLIPRPLDVDALMRTIPKGSLVTTSQLRERLARNSQADYSCPLTTGIFVRIAAEAAEEDLRIGKEPMTPYWRVIKGDGSLNEKLPGGADAQAARLEKEGHTILPGRGKKPPRVQDFEKHLQGLFSEGDC